MTTPRYDDIRLQPLTTDALIEARVAALVGKAIRSQLWFLFLDGEQRQLPLLVPVGGLPAWPDSSMPALADRLGEKMDEVAAASVVVVVERYADRALTAADRRWARAVHDAFDERRLAVRAILLSHRAGVRWVAQDDYRFGER
jgi:hypothetical protein